MCDALLHEEQKLNCYDKTYYKLLDRRMLLLQIQKKNVSAIRSRGSHIVSHSLFLSLIAFFLIMLVVDENVFGYVFMYLIYILLKIINAVNILKFKIILYCTDNSLRLHIRIYNNMKNQNNEQ